MRYWFDPIHKTHKIIIGLIICVLGLSACRKEAVEVISDPIENSTTANCSYILEAGCPDSTLQKSHLLLGNPSDAAKDLNTPNNYLISLPQYKVSYNRDRGIPNWVSWHSSKEWLGDAPRQNDYRVYWDLPLDWFYVTTSDYTNTGFNRGHSCPSGDRKCSEYFNSETYYMINIVPQSPNHNQGPWLALEEYCRELIEVGHELYIISGNYGEGGVGENGYANTIADGNITVPESIWKVIVVLSEGENDLERVSTSTRVIAVDMVNDENVIGVSWGDFRVSVDAIEAKTNLDLLSNLPNNLEEVLEDLVDDGDI